MDLFECDCCGGKFPDVATTLVTIGTQGQTVRLCVLCLVQGARIVVDGMKAEGIVVEGYETPEITN